MYEIYALNIGEIEVESSTIFYQTDIGKKIAKAFYFLCLKSKHYTILVDTGISPDEAAIRGIESHSSREELLSRIYVRPSDVDAIILTHLHSDHFTEPEIYPNSIFYLQRKEFQFWNEEIQRFHNILYPPFSKDRPVADIESIQKLNSQKRVRFLDEDNEIYPGISSVWCGGHTPGSQMITVQTERGNVLCCSDFIDSYRNWDEQIPVGVLTSLVEWLKGIGKIEQMRLPGESIIPGHDPRLMRAFPEVAENVVRIA